MAVIAAGIWINFAPTQERPYDKEPVPPTQETLYGKVTIRAINLDNQELVATVTVEGKDFKGETPYSLVLPYGIYTFVLKYQNIEVKRTIEINQPVQEVIIQFNIRAPPIKVDLEITADELAAKIEKAYTLKEEGRLSEAKELEDWLLSLKNKTVKITGEVEKVYTFPKGHLKENEAAIIFMKRPYIQFGESKIVVWGEKETILKAPWKKTIIFEEMSGPLPRPKEGDIVTVIGKIIWLYPENPEITRVTGISCYIELVEIVKVF